MKNHVYFILTLCCLAISCDTDESTSQVEANLVLSTCTNIDFTDNCTGPSLFNNTRFINEQYANNIEGWSYGTISCISPVNECFGVILRRHIIQEFAKHTNNLSCGLKASPCPTSGYTLVACYDNNDGIFLDLEDIPGVNLGDGVLQIQEANLIYQEFMCRILNDVDTSDSEFIKINNMIFDACLCGGSGVGLSYIMEVYREN